MENFEQSWEKVAITRDGENVSLELRHLLQQAHEKIVEQPPKLPNIKIALENLLLYLNTPSGRTKANCFATDLFFALADWDIDWEIFPESFTDIIGEIGGALHDAIDKPEIAKNFGGLPEQLLERIKEWKPN